MPRIQEGGQAEEEERPSFAFVDVNGFVAQSVEQGRWKLIETSRPVAKTSLFARSDAGELHDLSEHSPILAGWLASRLRWERARGRERRLAAPGSEVDPELESRLRAMGYLR